MTDRSDNFIRDQTIETKLIVCVARGDRRTMVATWEQIKGRPISRSLAKMADKVGAWGRRNGRFRTGPSVGDAAHPKL